MSAVRAKVRQYQRPVALDATTSNGVELHVLVAASAIERDEPSDDGDGAAPRYLALIATDLLEVRALDRDAREADAEAVRCRARAAEIEARVREYVDAERLAVLGGLSPGQLRIVQARITLSLEGASVTHNAVARLLGVSAATVSKQWKRMESKRDTAALNVTHGDATGSGEMMQLRAISPLAALTGAGIGRG